MSIKEDIKIELLFHLLIEKMFYRCIESYLKYLCLNFTPFCLEKRKQFITYIANVTSVILMTTFKC